MSLLAEKIHAWAQVALLMNGVGDEFVDGLYRSYAVNPAAQSDSLPYYRFLYLIMNKIKPALAVELGVQRGVGTAHMAAGWSRGTIIGVDKEFTETARQVSERFPCISYINADTVAAAAQIPDGIGLLFVDAGHTAARVRAELKAYTPLLCDEALVLFDNLYHPSYPEHKPVYEAFYEFPHLRLELSELSPGWGFGAAIYKR